MTTWVPTPLARASIWLHRAAVPALVLAPGYWPYWLGALAANHAVLACGMHPRSQLAGPSLVRLPLFAKTSAAQAGPAQAGLAQAGPGVALTFDDGPDPQVTPRVLDLLDDRGAKASFFCIGTRAALHPALLREIVRRGHTLGNHTWSHPYGFAAYAPGPMRREVERAQAVLSDLAGVAPRWFRAPMGLRSPALDPILARAGLHHVGWTRRAYDWSCHDPAVIARRLTRTLAAGDILVLHDGNSAHDARGRAVVLDALPAVLDAIRAAGQHAVPLPHDAGSAPVAAAASPPSTARAST